MYAQKIIVSAKSTLILKYGTGFSKIKKLFQNLKTADKKRGIATRIVFIDDATSATQAGIKPVKNVNAREC